MSRRKLTVKGRGPDGRVTFSLEAYQGKVWITSCAATSPGRATVARLFGVALFLDDDAPWVELRTPGRPNGRSDHDPPIR